MTVTTTTASQTFQGNSTATAFPCTFEIFEDTDINVYFVNPATGTQTQAVLNTDYTVVGAGASAGFTVNTTVAVPTGTNLYVVRALPLTQLIDLTNEGAFFPNLHEAAFDRLCMQIQQIANYSEGLNVTMPPGLVPQPSTLFPIPQAGSLIGWNAAGNALVNTGPTTGAGGISDINIATNAAIKSTKIDFNQPLSSLFFSQNGAVINRVNDRIFLGGATPNDGAYPGTQKDWLTAFQSVELGDPNASLAGMLAVLTNGSNAAATAICAASQSLNFTSTGTSGIGIEAIVLNNNATHATNTWAIYGEAHRTTAAAGSTYGMELDVRTLTAAQNSTPYQQGTVTGIQLGAGAGVSSAGQSPPSAAIEIIDNPMQWQAGIVFNKTSIVGSDGVSAGTGDAIRLAMNHALQWYGPGAVVTGRVVARGTTNANAVTVELSNGAFNLRSRANDSLQLFAEILDTAVNYPALYPGVTGQGVQFASLGTDTNIDLNLVPKGSGEVLLPTTSKLGWQTGGTKLSWLQCAATSAATAPDITFADGQIQFKANGNIFFQTIFSSTDVNYLQTYSSGSGSPIQLVAAGSDTNIDIKLLPKGTGDVWLGAYTSGAPTATGYITVKDASGTIRKLLCA